MCCRAITGGRLDRLTSQARVDLGGYGIARVEQHAEQLPDRWFVRQVERFAGEDARDVALDLLGREGDDAERHVVVVTEASDVRMEHLERSRWLARRCDDRADFGAVAPE